MKAIRKTLLPGNLSPPQLSLGPSSSGQIMLSSPYQHEQFECKEGQAERGSSSNNKNNEPKEEISTRRLITGGKFIFSYLPDFLPWFYSSLSNLLYFNKNGHFRCPFSVTYKTLSWWILKKSYCLRWLKVFQCTSDNVMEIEFTIVQLEWNSRHTVPSH